MTYNIKNKEHLYNLLVTLSYSETIGFFNGTWEFNYNNNITNIQELSYFTFRIIQHYYSLGNKNINIKNLNASDDTILNFCTIHSIINNDYKSGFLHYKNKLLEDKRASGFTTTQNIKFINENPNKHIKYQNDGGGNGAAIRTSPIGILFHNYKDIITKSFLNSIITHNNAIGFLGGIASALITNFAYNNISPNLWLNKLIELEDEINTIIKLNFDQEDYILYLKDKKKFWDKIKDYNEYKTKIYLENKQFYDYQNRIEYLLNLFRPNYKNSRNINIGGGAHESIIMAFEAILLSYNNKNKLIDFDQMIFYGVLHAGDNDSTGAICAAWYSAFTKKIPENIKPNQLEFIDEINKIIKNI